MLLTLTMVDCGGRTEVLGPNTLVDLGSQPCDGLDAGGASSRGATVGGSGATVGGSGATVGGSGASVGGTGATVGGTGASVGGSEHGRFVRRFSHV